MNTRDNEFNVLMIPRMNQSKIKLLYFLFFRGSRGEASYKEYTIKYEI